MSAKERGRAHVIRQVVDRKLRQRRAAELLGIGVRQVKRLVASYRRRGDRGLVSGRRGKPSNNRLLGSVVGGIEAALRDRYADFGATLAAEKLGEHEGIAVSAETVRQIQIRLGLWQPRRRRARRVFQIRERRARFGELIQVDGSHHAWLEGRGARCALLVFIDDATGRLTGLLFAKAETARGYLELLRSHILAHGVPLALYSDRHGIFRVNAKDAESGDGLTEPGRVVGRLGIEQICRTSPCGVALRAILDSRPSRRPRSAMDSKPHSDHPAAPPPPRPRQTDGTSLLSGERGHFYFGLTARAQRIAGSS